MSVSRPVNACLYRSIRLLVCLPASLYVCLSIQSLMALSVHLLIYLSVYPLIRLSASLVSQPAFCVSLVYRMSVYLVSVKITTEWYR